MAGNLIKIGNMQNSCTCEYVVDTVKEIAYLPTTTTKASGSFKSDPNFNSVPQIGSTCVCGNGDGEVLMYMLFSNGWKQL